MSISVCLASYNGEKYIEEQLNSIFNQLSDDDEIIIVDDCSTDRTIEILKEFKDPRIKIFVNDRNYGHVYTFSRSILLAKNELILLSDQDDIWLPDRVKIMINKLMQSSVLVLTSNFGFIDAKGNELTDHTINLQEKDSKHYMKNIFDIFFGKKDYFGCAMALRRNEYLLNVLFPIPQFVESHDLWIAIASNMIHSNIHIEDKTLMRRIHGNNVSLRKRGLLQKIQSRIVFLKSILVILFRHIKKNRLTIESLKMTL